MYCFILPDGSLFVVHIETVICINMSRFDEFNIKGRTWVGNELGEVTSTDNFHYGPCCFKLGVKENVLFD